MISSRGLLVHLLLLGVACAVAFSVWTKEDAPRKAKKAQVQVWAGRVKDLKSIQFEAEDRSVHLSARKDSVGAYFEGKVEKTVRMRPPPRPRVDAGPDAAVPPPPKAPPPKKETVRFVGVEQATKLAESLAPLMALRALGLVEAARDEEFGFDKPAGTLKVTLGSTTHSLVIGGTTPGGGDRYVRLESGEAYAIEGSVAQNLMFAESRLVERDLFGFENDEIAKVVIKATDRSRELVRVADKKGAWADSESPKTQDETAGNWMNKLTKLRIMSYEPPEIAAPEAFVNVEFFAKGGRRLGKLSLHKSATPDGKSRFTAQTAHTRWHAEVLSSAAEQIHQDLPSVLK